VRFTVAAVLASDSRFIQASVNTLFVDISWRSRARDVLVPLYSIKPVLCHRVTRSKPDFNSALRHVLLRLAHGEFAEMENARSENRVGAALEDPAAR